MCNIIIKFIIEIYLSEREVSVIFTYEPLWATLKEKGITQYELINNYHFSTGTLDALRKNKSITMNTLHDICIMLDCPIEAVVKVINSKK